MDREVVIILGKTGYGKSTWLRKFAVKFPKLFVFDPFRAMQAEYLTSEQILERHDKGDFKNRSRFSVGSNILPDLDLLGAVSFLTGNCVFVIEECGVAFHKGERIPDWLSEIIFLGRHQSVSVVLTAQRAASIPIELRSQASRFVSFRQTEKHDVKWCEDYVGDRAQELATLPKFECLDADNEGVSRYAINPPGSRKPEVAQEKPLE